MKIAELGDYDDPALLLGVLYPNLKSFGPKGAGERTVRGNRPADHNVPTLSQRVLVKDQLFQAFLQHMCVDLRRGNIRMA